MPAEAFLRIMTPDQIVTRPLKSLFGPCRNTSFLSGAALVGLGSCYTLSTTPPFATVLSSLFTKTQPGIGSNEMWALTLTVATFLLLCIQCWQWFVVDCKNGAQTDAAPLRQHNETQLLVHIERRHRRIWARFRWHIPSVVLTLVVCSGHIAALLTEHSWVYLVTTLGLLSNEMTLWKVYALHRRLQQAVRMTLFFKPSGPDRSETQQH